MMGKLSLIDHYAGTFSGVPVQLNRWRSLIEICMDHPLGISPSSDSSNESGNNSLISSGSPVGRPSTFALTGSKFTNQDLNSAFAMPSRVSLVFRFSSILSSSLPRILAIAFAHLSGGKLTQISLGRVESLDFPGYCLEMLAEKLINLWRPEDSIDILFAHTFNNWYPATSERH